MKVFLCEHIHPDARKKLERHAEVVGDWDRLGEADALINRNLRITREVLDRAENLKVIAIHGTGTDGVDLDEAIRRGVKVVYAPHRNAVSVAELIAGLIVSVARKIPLSGRMIEAGRAHDFASLTGLELRGKTLGLIGFGGISRALAGIMRDGFGMEVVAASRSLTPETARDCGVAYAPGLMEVLCRSDVVNVGVPLSDETRGMIGAEAISHMKDGAIFINTARGPIVDEAALFDALHSGKLWGAACDVFSEEPVPPEHPLLRLPNFIATPHIGSNTEDALRRLGFDCVDQILDVLAGRTPQFPLAGW